MRFFNKMKNYKWGEREDYQWQYYEERASYNWLKKLAASALIFGLVYCAHISETAVGQNVDNGIRYMLNTETDFNYIIDKIVNNTPQDIDLSVLKRVQKTISKPADPLQYMLKPVNGKIKAPFGWYTHPVLKQEMMHEGLDMEAELGTNVMAAAPGKVKIITDSAKIGKTIIIEHSQDIDTVYGHLGEVLVAQDDVVSQGQVIAKVGKTGMTNVPQLYFEVREKDKAVDPMTRLRNVNSGEGK